MASGTRQAAWAFAFFFDVERHAYQPCAGLDVIETKGVYDDVIMNIQSKPPCIRIGRLRVEGDAL